MKSRRETDQHYGGRSVHQSQLSGFLPLPGVDLAIAADAEATLPSSIEETKRLITADRKRGVRGSRSEAGCGARESARPGAHRWRPMPGTRARSARLGCARSCGRKSRMRIGPWCRSSGISAGGRCGCGLSTSNINTLAAQGGGGMGYNAPASVGAALANQKARAAVGEHSGRWRSVVCSGGAVDRGASPDSAAERDA